MSDIDELIETIATKEMAALRTERYFRERAGSASPADFLAILEKAGTHIAIEGDKLPPEAA